MARATPYILCLSNTEISRHTTFKAAQAKAYKMMKGSVWKFVIQRTRAPLRTKPGESYVARWHYAGRGVWREHLEILPAT